MPTIIQSIGVSGDFGQMSFNDPLDGVAFSSSGTGAGSSFSLSDMAQSIFIKEFEPLKYKIGINKTFASTHYALDVSGDLRVDTGPGGDRQGGHIRVQPNTRNFPGPNKIVLYESPSGIGQTPTTSIGFGVDTDTLKFHTTSEYKWYYNASGTWDYIKDASGNNISVGKMPTENGNLAMQLTDNDLSLNGNLTMHGNVALKIPVGTTAQRPVAINSTHAGYIRYNTTNSSFEGFGAGNSWGTLGGTKDVDQDTYITAEDYAGADNDQLKFFTDNTLRMTVAKNGFVGVGISNPAVALDINGSIKFTGDMQVSGGIASEADFISQSNSTSHDLIFKAGTTERVRIKGDGKLGIGTDNPSRNLHIHSSSTPYIQLTGGNMQSGTSDGLQIGIWHDSSTAFITNYEAADIVFKTNNNEKMRIKNTGRIGIGSNMPGSMLDVNGSIRGGYDTNTTSYFGRAAVGFAAASDQATFAHLDHNNGSGFALSQNQYGETRLNSAGSQKLHLSNNNSPLMTLLSNGNIGIGTNNPAVKLHINSTDAIKIPVGTTAQRPTANSSSHYGYIRYNTTNSSYEGFGAGNTWGSLGGVKDVDQDTYISAETSAGADNDQIKFYSAGVQRMIVDSSGGVAIGKDIPAETLDVSGNILIDNGINPFSTIVEPLADLASNAASFGTSPDLTYYYYNSSTSSWSTSSAVNNGRGALVVHTDSTYGTYTAWTNSSGFRDYSLHALFDKTYNWVYQTNGKYHASGTPHPKDDTTGNGVTYVGVTGIQISLTMPNARKLTSFLMKPGWGSRHSPKKYSVYGSSTYNGASSSFTLIQSYDNSVVDSAINNNISSVTNGHSSLYNTFTIIITEVNYAGTSNTNMMIEDIQFNFVTGNSTPGGSLLFDSQINIAGPNKIKYIKDDDKRYGVGIFTDEVRHFAKTKSSFYYESGGTASNPAYHKAMELNEDDLTIEGDFTVKGNFNITGAFNKTNTNVQVTDQIDISNNGTGPALIVRQHGNDNIADFYDDTTLAMRIKNGGNIGIGTDNPSVKLQIGGNVSGQSIGNNIVQAATFQVFDGNYRMETQQSQLAFRSQGGNGIGFYTTAETSNNIDNSKMIIKGSNVGIGTTGPTEKLHVEGNIKATGWVRGGANTHTMSQFGYAAIGSKSYYNTMAYFGHENQLSNNNYAILQENTGTTYVNSASGKEIHFRHNNDSKMILKDGKIGIGTNIPTMKLHLHETDANTNTTLQISHNTSGNSVNDGFHLVVERTSNIAYLIQRENANMQFYTNNQPRMAINGSGDVGIGTNNPSRQFHIHHSTTAYLQLTNNSTGTGGSDGFQITLNSAKDAFITQRHAANLIFNTNNSEKMRIDSSGNIGIGTNNPSKNLDICGSANTSLKISNANTFNIVKFHRTTSTSYSFLSELQIWINGTNVATSGTATSDDYGWGGTADKAIDNNRGTGYNAGSTTSTGWQVELAQSYPMSSIQAIQVWPRNDYNTYSAINGHEIIICNNDTILYRQEITGNSNGFSWTTGGAVVKFTGPDHSNYSGSFSNGFSTSQIVSDSWGLVGSTYTISSGSGPSFIIDQSGNDTTFNSSGKYIFNNNPILTKTVGYNANVDEPYLIAGSTSHTGANSNWGTYGFQHRIKSLTNGVARVTIDYASNGSTSEAFCVNTMGKVGIHTNDPSHAFHVNSHMKLTGNLFLGTGSVSQSELGYLSGVTSSIQSQINSISSGGISLSLDGISDVKYGGTNFSSSLLIGSTNTGTLNNANYNVGIGKNIFYQLTSGESNTAVGYNAMHQTTTGDENTAIGLESLYANTTGEYNVAVGRKALLGNTTGQKNTALGRNAGDSNTTGSHNTYVGSSADAGANNYNYSTALGFSAQITASNQIMLGRSSENVSIPGNLGIGTDNPSRNLHIHSSSTPYIQLTGGTSMGTGSTDGFQIGMWHSSSNAFLTNYEAGDIIFKTNNDEKMRIKNSGNFGIGTNAPGSALHIFGDRANNTQDEGIHLGRTGSSGNYNQGMEFATSGTFSYIDFKKIGTGGADYHGRLLYNALNHNMEFYTNTSNKMTIDTCGNLIYGTSGNNRLDVLTDELRHFASEKHSFYYQPVNCVKYIKVDANGQSYPIHEVSLYQGTTDIAIGATTHRATGGGPVTQNNGSISQITDNNLTTFYRKDESANTNLWITLDDDVEFANLSALVIRALDRSGGDVFTKRFSQNSGTNGQMSFFDANSNLLWTAPAYQGNGSNVFHTVHVFALAQYNSSNFTTYSKNNTSSVTASYSYTAPSGLSTPAKVEQINFDKDTVNIPGNLVVSGTTTTLNTTNTTISDSLIELSSGLTSAANNDAGIIIERGSTGNNAFMGWDESADKFVLGTTTATGSSSGNLSITKGDLDISNVSAASITLGGSDLQTQLNNLNSGGGSQWNTVNTNEIHYSSGNVGIGTNNPDSALHINADRNNTTQSEGIHFGRNANGSDYDHAMEIVSSGTNSYIDFKKTTGNSDYDGRIIYNHTDNKFRFYTNNTLRMTLDTNGYLGISNDSPANRLDVNGTGLIYHSSATHKTSAIHAPLSLRNDGVTATYSHGRPCLSMDWDTGSSAHWVIGQGGTTGVDGATSTMGIGWGEGGTFGWTPRFFLTTDGKFGINKKSPSYKLDVDGDINFTGTLRQNGTAFSGGASSLNGLTDVKYGGSNFSNSLFIGHTTTGTLNGATNNIAIGKNAFKSVTSCPQSIAIGVSAMQSQTGGSGNVAIGYEAIKSGNNNQQCVAVGWKALHSGSSFDSTAVGAYSAPWISSGRDITAIGRASLYGVSSGSHNTGCGVTSLLNVSSGSFNTGMGKETALTLTTGSNNSFLGYKADVNSASSSYRTVIGSEAEGTVDNSVTLGRSSDIVTIPGKLGIKDTSPSYELDVTGDINFTGTLRQNGSAFGGGASSLDGLSDVKAGGTNFSNSLIIGHTTTGTLSNANFNVAVGNNALKSITSGSQNVAIGYQSMQLNTNAGNNTSIGYNALRYNTSGGSNDAHGVNALNKNTSGTKNVAMGASALQKNTTGTNNTAFGYQSLNNNLTTHSSTALGWRAAYNNKISYTVAVGYESLHENVTGISNTAVGYKALRSTTSGYNVALGYQSGDTNTTGSNNTYIGYNADANANNYTYSTAIGSGSQITASNQIVLGRSNETVLIPGALDISTEVTPAASKATFGATIHGMTVTKLRIENTTGGSGHWSLGHVDVFDFDGNNLVQTSNSGFTAKLFNSSDNVEITTSNYSNYGIGNGWGRVTNIIASSLSNQLRWDNGGSSGSSYWWVGLKESHYVEVYFPSGVTDINEITVGPWNQYAFADRFSSQTKITTYNGTTQLTTYTLPTASSYDYNFYVISPTSSYSTYVTSLISNYPNSSYLTNIITDHEPSMVTNKKMLQLSDTSTTAGTINLIPSASGAKVGIGSTDPTAPLHIYKLSSTNTELMEVMKLETFSGTGDIGTGANSLGGYIGLYANDDNAHADGEVARISWRSDNANNNEGDGRIGFWTSKATAHPNNGGTYSMTEKMTITRDGKVGIGDNAPSHTLDVTGDINFTGTLYQNGSAFSGGGGGSSQWTTSGSNIYYSSGNVGIGTNSPQQKLEVHGNILLGKNDEDTFIHGGRNAAFTSDSNLLLVADSNLTSGVGTNNSDLIFGYGSNVNMDSVRNTSYPSTLPRVETMRIKSSNSYVGIGTNNPDAKLHVNGRAKITGGVDITGTVAHEPATTGIHLGTVSGSSHRLLAEFCGTTSSNSDVMIDFTEPNDDTHGRIYYHLGSNYMTFDTNDVERLRITNNGDVGIGTNNPARNFHIHNSSGTTFLQMTSGTSMGTGTLDGLQVYLSSSNNASIINRENGKLAFGTNNAERMVLQSNGTAQFNHSVGIGTANPGNMLSLNTNSNFDGMTIYNSSNNNQMAAIRKNDDDSGYLNLYAGGSSKITLVAKSGEVSCINNGGNFGIGTNTPSKRLHVAGTSIIGSGVNNITPAGVGDPSIQCSSIVLHNNSNSDQMYIRRIATAEYQFQTGNNTGELHFQPYGGNVGIGTNNPSGKLHIFSTSNLYVEAENTTGTSYVGFRAQGNGGNISMTRYNASYTTSGAQMADGCLISTGTNDGYGLNFRTASSGNNANMRFFTNNDNERMTITKDGNVGIGTNSPSEKLQVNGRLRINGVGTSPGIWFGGNGVNSDNGNVFFGRASGSFTGIGFYFSSWQHAFLDNGKVGIGKTNPSYTLDVTGDINFTGTLYQNGSAFSGGGGSSTLDGITGIKNAGTNFGNSIIIGNNQTGSVLTGTLNNATANTGLGYHVMRLITSGDANTAMGSETLQNLTTGGYNTSMGHRAMQDCTTGNQNTAVGFHALQNSTTASDNTSIGAYTIAKSTSATQLTAVGKSGLHNVTTGSYNVTCGGGALYWLTTGTYNTALGRSTGQTLTTGSHNTLLGEQANVSSASSSYRTVIGKSAVGSYNNSCTIGRAGGDDTLIVPGKCSIGRNNIPPSGCLVGIGDGSGQINSIQSWNSSYPPLLNVRDDTYNDSSSIVHFSRGSSNYQFHAQAFSHKRGSGDAFQMSTSSGHVYIGNSTRGRYIRFNTSGQIAPSTSFSGAYSDDRIKFNEIDISNCLSIVRQLKAPQRYERFIPKDENDQIQAFPTDLSWNEVKSNDDIDYYEEIGFIAQDIKTIPELSFAVTGEEHDASGNATPLMLDYGNIHNITTGAVRELDIQQQADKAEIANLKTQVATLENKVQSLETQMATVLQRLQALENP